MVKPPIVWGNLSFREEGRPDQKKKKKKRNFQITVVNYNNTL